MRLDEAIDGIERSVSLAELKVSMQAAVESYGFSSFGFVSVGVPEVDVPFWIATSDERWNRDYQQNGFYTDDPVVRHVRRTNVPFSWSDVVLPLRLGKRKPAAHRIMEAARDHGLTEGYVVPFHFVDRLGRINSASGVLYWTDKPPAFHRVPRQQRAELHLLMIYLMQKALEIRARADRPTERLADKAGVQLTDRERLVLEWAGRGKTAVDTADILKISVETVNTHIANAMRKLDAANKTHAIVKAIKAALIDP